MANNLTPEQRKWILKQYWKLENTEKVRTAWKENFETSPPSRQTIYNIKKKFERTGSVRNAPKSGRPKTALTKENARLVAKILRESPGKSTRSVSAELSIPRTSLRRLIEETRLRAHQPQLGREGLEGEDDPETRKKYCEMMKKQMMEEAPSSSDKTDKTD